MSGTNQRKSYKIVLLGDPRVGKTSIRRRYLGKGFEQNYNVTLGADFAVKRLKDNKGILQIWDLAGQPIYKSVRSGYYSGAEGCLLVFDVIRPQSFQNTSKWLDELVSISKKTIPIILVGNKIDLIDDTQNHVKENDAMNYAEKLTDWSGFNVPYIKSSALTGFNIDTIFQNLVEEIKYLKSTEAGN